jgi:hypothetical protein
MQEVSSNEGGHGETIPVLDWFSAPSLSQKNADIKQHFSVFIQHYFPCWLLLDLLLGLYLHNDLLNAFIGCIFTLFLTYISSLL